MKKLKIVLASGSPRRQQMMKLLKVPYDIVISNYEEKNSEDDSPAATVKKHAKNKVADVIERANKGVIVGADTIVYLDGKILGKPKNINDAHRMLKKIQGRVHVVYTGMALYDTSTKKWIVDYIKTKVSIRKLSEKEITRYFELINPLDKAGAYAIQEAGSLIVDKITGCYYNVLGFPVSKLEDMLQSLNYTLF